MTFFVSQAQPCLGRCYLQVRAVTTQRWIWLLASLRSMAVLSSRAHELQSREKNKIFLSPRRVSPFLAWSDFHARSNFARSTIPEEKWGIFTLRHRRHAGGR